MRLAASNPDTVSMLKMTIAKRAAKEADELLAEFDARFPVGDSDDQ